MGNNGEQRLTTGNNRTDDACQTQPISVESNHKRSLVEYSSASPLNKPKTNPFPSTYYCDYALSECEPRRHPSGGRCRCLRRYSNLFHLPLDTLDGLLVQRLCLRRGRFTGTITAAFMRAAPAYRLRVLEKRVALMASPPYVSSDASQFASSEWEGLLRVTRVAMRIFVEFRSMSG